MKKTKFKMKEKPILPTILIAALLSVAFGMLMTAVLAYFTLNNTITYSAAKTWITIIHFVSALFGGILTVIGNIKKGILLPLMTTGVYILILLGSNILFVESGINISIAEILAIFLPVGIMTSFIFQKGRSGAITKFRR